MAASDFAGNVINAPRAYTDKVNIYRKHSC